MADRSAPSPGSGLTTEVTGPITALLAVHSSSQSNRNRREVALDGPERTTQPTTSAPAPPPDAIEP